MIHLTAENTLNTCFEHSAQEWTLPLTFYNRFKKDKTCTFEVSDTVSQLPPVRENFPDPILRRISSGVSFGPLANGVYLKQEKGKKKNTCIKELVWKYV